MLLKVCEAGAVSTQGTGGEEAIVRRLHKRLGASGECGDRNEARLGLDIIAAEQVQAIELVARNKPLDLVEKRQRIKGAQLWLQSIGGEPDGMAVGFASLGTARLAKVGLNAAMAEGNEFFPVGIP